MYPIFDETLYKALLNTEEPALDGYKIKLPGPKTNKPEPRYIQIQHSDDDLVSEDLDNGDERRIYYILEVGIKKIGYLDAMRLGREVTAAIKRITHLSEDMVYNPGEDDEIDFRGEVRVDKAIPEYDTKSNLVKKAHIQISLLVYENYDMPEEEFDEIEVTGGLSE